MFLVCGEALLDMFAEDTAKGLSFDARVGGSPFNVAIGLTRLGIHAGLFAGLSTDFLGARLHTALDEEGVDTRHLVIKQGPTTLAFVSVGADGGAEYAFYGNGAADRSLAPADLPILGSDVTGLHTGSFSLVADPTGQTLLQLFRQERGKRLLSLDPNVRLTVQPDRDLWRNRVADFAECADVIKISWEDVEGLYPGATASSLASDWLVGGVQLVVFTFGADGAEAFTKTQRIKVPGHQIETVQDTIGAGDTFQAALLTGLLEEGGAPGSLDQAQLARILDLATRAAAITCSRRGADMPRRAELLPQR